LTTVRELFEKGSSLLQPLPLARLDAKLLLLRAASLDERSFFSDPEARLPRVVEKRYLRLVAERAAGAPLSYLTGTREFWSIAFRVTPSVLIPRPETELLVEKALELSLGRNVEILDVGTGCGNIAIALAKELPEARIAAADVSLRALKVAGLNAGLQNTQAVEIVRSDIFSAFRKSGRRFDLVVSNPPYVSDGDWKKLPSGIKDFEPKGALVPGPTGLEVIRRLVGGSPSYLYPGGHLLFEIGLGQAGKVIALFDETWESVETARDLWGIERAVVARRR
jgi:release factor glutamine methyltransferase